MKLTKTLVYQLSYKVIGAAINVHKAIGPGLLESVYHEFLKHELNLLGLSFETEFLVPVSYKGHEVKTPLRCDLLIEDLLVVEIKSIDAILPVHQAQLFTYMTLLQKPKGLLLNFNVANIYKEGQKTMVNKIYSVLPN